MFYMLCNVLYVLSYFVWCSMIHLATEQLLNQNQSMISDGVCLEKTKAKYDEFDC